MTISQSELAPQLTRLFYMAGLLDNAEAETGGPQEPRHKPILDVLTQEVSLGTFRDLFTAEISFKSRRWSQGTQSGLHEGLTATGMINNEELKALLAAQRPAVRPLLEPLLRDGYLNQDAVERASEREGAADPSWLVAEGILSAQMICQWLSNGESDRMRQAAIFLATYILKHNKLLTESNYKQLMETLGSAGAGEMREYLGGKLGLNSQKIGEKLQDGISLPEAQLGSIQIDAETLRLFPQTMVRRQMMVPFHFNGHSLGVATSDPLNIPLTALLHWISGRWPYPHFVAGGPLLEKINEIYRGKPAAGGAHPARTSVPAVAAPPVKAPAASRPPAEAGPEVSLARPARIETDIAVDNVSAVQLVSSIIESAIELHTTDIHIEPTRSGLVVRFRIDGELHRIMTVPAALAQTVVSRVKVLADMDVTERRRPQDGHFELRVDHHNFDFRISTLPAVQGETLVIRILDESQVSTGLDGLGLLAKQQQLVESIITQPYGLVLVTGPTGSGKTSTLYAALNLLNKENRNLVTIEDPVEYQLEGINQVQVDPHIGLTFSDGLRSILRQDPDVIMVGEIRDGDTAHNAIRAAMTGHLVFSTLHTNTALGAINALVHLGAVPFMVANSLLGIISQRLVRKLCRACCKPVKTTALINRQLGLAEDLRKRIFKAQGCDECLKSGYMGRSGVFEVIRFSEPLRPMITLNQIDELERAMRGEQMISLQEAGAQKVLDGVTSVEEVARKVIFDV